MNASSQYTVMSIYKITMVFYIFKLKKFANKTIQLQNTTAEIEF